MDDPWVGISFSGLQRFQSRGAVQKRALHDTGLSWWRGALDTASRYQGGNKEKDKYIKVKTCKDEKTNKRPWCFLYHLFILSLKTCKVKGRYKTNLFPQVICANFSYTAGPMVRRWFLTIHKELSSPWCSIIQDPVARTFEILTHPRTMLILSCLYFCAPKQLHLALQKHSFHLEYTQTSAREHS